MRRLLFILALALTSCAQPPRATPVVDVPPPLTPVPRYPSWDDVPASSPTDWHLDSPAESQPLFGDATLLNLGVRRRDHSVELELILFDDRVCDLRVIDQPEDWSGGGQITECMRKAGAIAGVNGGFFTPQFTPMGLMIADGQKTGAWQSNPLLTGAVVVRDTPQLLWNAEIRTRDARDLLQAGPRLVDASRPVTGLERVKHTTRTFIATDGDHRWIIGLARGVSLGELAEILATPRLLPGFNVHRALNLDGGRSSAIYYRTMDNREHTDPGWSTVRNYLAVSPR